MCGRIRYNERTAPRFHLLPATAGATKRQDCSYIPGILSGWWAWCWFYRLHRQRWWSLLVWAVSWALSDQILRTSVYSRISGTWADHQKRSSLSYIQDRTSVFHAWAKMINPLVRNTGFHRVFLICRENSHCIWNTIFPFHDNRETGEKSVPSESFFW